MTVCIGTMCANAQGAASKSVIVASDRMVTMAIGVEFEHEVPKVTQICSKVVALMAGDAYRGSRLIRSLKTIFQNATPSVEQVAKAAAEQYAISRYEQIDKEIFQPRGISLQQFYNTDLQTKLLREIVGALDNLVGNYNYGVELLIAGVDDVGGHVFVIGNPGGIATEALQIGFTAIGSGTAQATQALIAANHHPGRTLDETLFGVYSAKRRAEVAPGVGNDTDLVVITDKGLRRLSSDELRQLAVIYNQHQDSMAKELHTQIQHLSVLSSETAEEEAAK